MSRRNFAVVVAVALAAVLTAGGLLASNMGFKLNYSLTQPAPTGAGTGKNTLALPYFRQTGINDSLQLMTDIGSGSVAPVVSISKFLEASDTYQVYTGRMGTPGANFALAAGDSYLVSMNTNTNYIVVGSHDPNATISMDAPGGGSATGKNYLAPPYHTTAVNSLDLMKDIDNTGGGISSVVSISRFLKATDTYQVYTGRMGTPGALFTLTPGEGYLVSMSATKSFNPSHY